MQTDLPQSFRDSARGARAEQILRSCVHCGFCNATCPTYQLLGDELDGPRGRIYLMKEMFESGRPDALVARHLDRCLTCRNCETTCPSGVAYGELVELGRDVIEAEGQRGWLDGLIRRALLAVVPEPRRFRPLVRLGRAFRWLLPAQLRRQVPKLGRRAEGVQAPVQRPQGAPARRVLVLEGCVQRVSTPEVNGALARLLGRHGIETLRAPAETCCGSLALHLGAHEQALDTVRRNLRALAPYLDQVEAVVSTASGCGVTLKDYPRLLAEAQASATTGADAELRALADALAIKLRDVAEYLAELNLDWQRDERFTRLAWHPPCTLQHGQRITGAVEQILHRAGYELVPVRDRHLCCGSAGTYALLQGQIADQLRQRKIGNLTEHAPDAVVTANIGCQLHLASGAGVPVLHWLEVLH
ncbi:MAG: glycolate oxidase subunit GlcF [Pseudomonadales bacterium]